eukprot:1349270-Amorphochlora_amoeboformis.AAC.1
MPFPILLTRLDKNQPRTPTYMRLAAIHIPSDIGKEKKYENIVLLASESTQPQQPSRPQRGREPPRPRETRGKTFGGTCLLHQRCDDGASRTSVASNGVQWAVPVLTISSRELSRVHRDSRVEESPETKVARNGTSPGLSRDLDSSLECPTIW